MPTYEYISADLLTGLPLSDLELYGTYMERNMSTTGQFTGSHKLGTKRFDDQSIVDATIPGRTCVYCLRDDVYIGGWIIWQRTYNSQARVIELQGLTFESFFSAAMVQKNYSVTQLDQIQIFKQLIDLMNTQRNNNIGIDTSFLQDQTSGILRDMIINDYDYVYYDSPLMSLVEAADGFDFTIDIADSGNPGAPFKYVRVGYPTLAPAGGDNKLAFDYPGNINQYWASESGSDAATTVAEIGSGTGSEMARAIAVNNEALNNGYPDIWKVISKTDISDIPTLSGLAQADRKRLNPPVMVPTIEIKSDRIPPFEDWSSLGITFNVNIQDPRFPDGVTLYSRMLGWQLNPQTDEQTETLTFTIEGGDIGAGL